MKQRALALILALCMVLTLLPVYASAAALQALPEPVLAPAALPDLPVQPQAGTYSITMTSTGHGKAELYATSAGARESVFFLADPDPGYKVSFDKCGYYKEHHDMRLLYIGSNVYEIIMPDGDVILDLEFVPITTGSHKVTVAACTGGKATVDQTSARKGESIFVKVTPNPGYSLESVKAKAGSSWAEGYYLGKDGSVELYEIFMPNTDLEIIATFKRNGPYTITSRIDSTPAGGTVKLSHSSAYELQTVTITATPSRGYKVSSVSCRRSQVTKSKTNVWTFPMPRSNEEVHISFAPITYSVSAVNETGIGGKVSLDRKTATIGQTVKLTCAPDKGYRVAQITGAKVTSKGSNTYTFVVDNANVKLSVLFLRENNPFLDVNETHFYYDSVIWAMDNGITNGVDATHFGSLNTCNRAQVVTFLWRAAGSPAPESRANPFVDVAKGTWYTDAVLWAVENGITNGVDATHFSPNTVCNRAQVVTFLYRSKGSPKITSTKNPFTDVKANSFYRNAVLWALENGVTTGTSDTTFNPNGQSLRAQAVTFLYRTSQIPEPKPDPLPFPGVG